MEKKPVKDVDLKVGLNNLHALLKTTEELLESDADGFNYQVAVDMLKMLSGAKYAAINIYEENCSRVVTRAFAGASTAAKRASEILGINLTGYSWEVKPEFLNALEGGRLVRFNTLHRLAMGLISEKQAAFLQQTFKIGCTYLVELTQGEKENLGNVVFFMPPGQEIENHETLELYAVLLGIFLGKLRTQQELAIQKDRFASIIEGANVGTYEWNVQTGETIFNDRWAEIIGYTLEELEPISIKTWTKHVHPDDRVRSNESFFRHVDGELDYYDVEIRMKHKNGNWVWINERGKVGSWTKDGKPLWAFGFHIDITERKAVESALRESEEKFRFLTENMSDVVWILDLNLKRTYVSPSIENIVGYTPEESMQQTLEQTVTPASLNMVLEVFNREFVNTDFNNCAPDKPIMIEAEYYHKNGSTVWMESNCNPMLDQEGRLIGVYGVSRDITEKKIARENLLKLNAALERQVRERAAVDAFTYSVSNDLRAPLRRIMGFGEALLEEYGDILDDRGQDYLQRINTQATHMDNLVVSMLELSKISRHDLEPEEIDLGVTFRSHIDRLNNQQPDRLVQAVTAPDLIARADLELIDTLVANLVENAWKYTAGKKKAVIEIGMEEKEGRRIFFIRDNGVGFDMCYVDKIFLPFQRLHVDDGYPGIGIGLNIAQRIITRHGGEIWAEGEINKGATFYFTLSPKLP